MSDTDSESMNEHLMSVFFEVQSDLPRQGPGDPGSTRKALQLCKGLPESPRVLDVGCGPGAQTLAIAEALPGALITAVDFHEPYLEQLRARAGSKGFSNRIETVAGDMSALPFPPESFDVVWAEGSAYVMGIANALRAWKPLLRKVAYLGFSELVWLTDDRPADAAAFFGQEYPAMSDPAGIAAEIADAGYGLLDHFTLPDTAWWEPYYTPLAARVSMLEKKYAGDETALSILASVRKEISVRASFGESYGYEFFVARSQNSRPTKSASNTIRPKG